MNLCRKFDKIENQEHLQYKTLIQLSTEKEGAGSSLMNPPENNGLITPMQPLQTVSKI